MGSALESFFITGYDKKGYLANKKPFLFPDQAWQTMENAYAFRERVLKREGVDVLGRLSRDLTNQDEGLTIAAATTITITDILTSFRAKEPNAELASSTLIITIGAPDNATFTDAGNGTFTVTGIGVQAGSYVNYATGKVVLHTTAAIGGASIRAAFTYYPNLPVMGISAQDQAAINAEEAVLFDQRYAYVYTGSGFTEYLPLTATTWDSTDSDFFDTFDYRGTNAGSRLLFVTNFVNSAANPMRYTDGSTWTAFTPAVDASNFLLSGRIILSYFSRLIVLNTWEGTALGSGTNYFARCRFSAQGNPTAVNAFRSDLFGQGGFLDAPTSEQIIGAEFVKNTLIVSFERSKWQLRYVGEYGLPFLWERVSVDFGSSSPFSTVVLDSNVLDIGDKAIVQTNAIECNRIDLDIPDQVWSIQNLNDGPQRVWGVRDYFKEIVFWNYPDVTTSQTPGSLKFPNKVLLYNYRNSTWAVFRDNVTAFGYLQSDSTGPSSPGVTWSSTEITWDDEDITWGNVVQSNPNHLYVVGGNQNGFVFLYAQKTPDDPSMPIQGIDFSNPAIRLTIPNHNLEVGEIIYIVNMMFIDNSTFMPVTSTINNRLYEIIPVDANTVSLYAWDSTTQSYESDFPLTFTQGMSSVPRANLVYVGGGTAALYPRLNLISKDINLFQRKGMATKLSYIDFLMKPTGSSVGVTIHLWENATDPKNGQAVSGNALVGNSTLCTLPSTGFYTPASDYAWFRFYSTLSAQYFNINITYDDDLMNTTTTHTAEFALYAINAFCKPGGRILF